ILVDEDVREHHRAEPEAVIERALVGKQLGDMAAKSADRALLDGDEGIMARDEIEDHLPVERFREPGIGDRRLDAPRGKGLACLQAFGEPRAEGEYGNARALPHDPSAPDRE